MDQRPIRVLARYKNNDGGLCLSSRQSIGTFYLHNELGIKKDGHVVFKDILDIAIVPQVKINKSLW